MANNSKTRNKYNIDDEIIIGYNTKMDKPKENKNNSKTKIKSSKNNNKKKKAKNSQNAKKSQKKKTGFLQVLKTILKIIIAILASICIIIFLFVSPVFSIQEIDVNGEEKLNESVYISLSNIQMGQNIFEIDKTSIKSEILKEPYVENVEVKRVYPNKIEINVTERHVSYMIESFGQYLYLDRNGYILERNSELLNYPIIRGYATDMENIEIGGRIEDVDIPKFNDLIKIIDALNNNRITANLTSIDISDDEKYILEFANEGKKVVLGSAKDLSAKMAWINLYIVDQKEEKGTLYLNSENIYFSPETN